MPILDCDDVRDTLAGYALDALDASEYGAVEAHLLGCRLHDAELAELRVTRLALGLLEAAPEPSVHLGARISEIPRALPVADGVTPLRTTMPGPRPRRLAAAPWAAAAAVLAGMAFGVGWVASDRTSDVPVAVAVAPAPEAPEATRYSYSMRGASGGLVRLAGVDGGDSVTVTMAGIEPLPEGKLYQLWAIRDGRWLRIGACNTDEQGGWIGDFSFAVRPGEDVALTVEPAGVEGRPSRPELLRARF